MATQRIFTVNAAGLKFGSAQFGISRKKRSTADKIVHDGDTLTVNTPANFGARFLGIDSPEVSFDFPGKAGFVGLDDPRWDAFFVNGDYREQIKGLSEPLETELLARIGDGTGVAANHARHAAAAQQNLEAQINQDMALSGKGNEAFQFFFAYGYEFLDGYGRLLCYVRPHRDNFEGETPAEASTDYNERQLAGGFAVPYFIFPNIDPFIRLNNPLDKKIVSPEGLWKLLGKAKKLNEARSAVQSARAAGKGIFDPADPLRILPMEIRTLARGSKPNRFVIDMGQPGHKVLLSPERYFEIGNVEDRLFIPPMFAEYFQLCGWELR